MSGVVEGAISGTWVPSWTGFLTDPSTVTAVYTLVGKLCFFTLNTGVNGTSNSTSFTVTLPFPARSGSRQRVACTVTNNGTQNTGAGVLRTNLGSNTADMFLTRAEAAGSWNSANFGKGCLVNGFYEIL